MNTNSNAVEALKPCPCCKSADISQNHDDAPVYCMGCGLRGLDAGRWNTRASLTNTTTDGLAGEPVAWQFRNVTADGSWKGAFSSEPKNLNPKYTFETRPLYTAPSPPPSGDVVEAVKPWEDCHGEWPDWEDPLRCVFESGLTYAERALAKALGVSDYSPCEGTECPDGDLEGTLFNIVLEVMPRDSDGDPLTPKEVCDQFTTLQHTTSPDALLREVRECLQRRSGTDVHGRDYDGEAWSITGLNKLLPRIDQHLQRGQP